LTAGIKANVDGSAAIQVGGVDAITLTSGGAATFVTSPTTVQAGTAAAPSITTSGDTNTGIFFPAADTVAIGTGGTEALRVNSAQNVGVGTTSPTAASSRRGLVLRGNANGAELIVQSTSATDGTSDGFSLTTVGTDAYLFNRLNGFTAFATNNTERARFNAGAPILCLSGGNTSATGTGIAFPATQSASSDANTLDDYEEGTFTATLSPGTSGSITLNSIYDVLSYTKIGRVVTITGQLVVTSVSSPVGSLVNLNNLPFPCADTSELSERAGGCTTYIDDSANSVYTQGMLLTAGDTFTRIYMTESGRVAAIAANDGFIFSFSYIAAT
jgi:hypothetical protein